MLDLVPRTMHAHATGFLRIFQTGLAYKKKENQINQPVSFEIPSRKNEDNCSRSINDIH